MGGGAWVVVRGWCEREGLLGGKEEGVELIWRKIILNGSGMGERSMKRKVSLSE